MRERGISAGAKEISRRYNSNRQRVGVNLFIVSQLGVVVPP